MKLGAINLERVLTKITTPLIKSYFADICHDYLQDMIVENRSRMFKGSAQMIDFGAAKPVRSSERVLNFGNRMTLANPLQALENFSPRYDVDSLSAVAENPGHNLIRSNVPMKIMKTQDHRRPSFI